MTELPQKHRGGGGEGSGGGGCDRKPFFAAGPFPEPGGYVYRYHEYTSEATTAGVIVTSDCCTTVRSGRNNYHTEYGMT